MSKTFAAFAAMHLLSSLGKEKGFHAPMIIRGAVPGRPSACRFTWPARNAHGDMGSCAKWQARDLLQPLPAC